MTKILIVSRDIQFLRVLGHTLAYSGFVVETAATQETVSKYLEEIKFSLILIDFNFKPTGGITFYQELNDLVSRPSVIMMGECYEEFSMIDNMYKMMDDYILKPFGMSELKMIVNRQLERKRLTLRPIIYGDLRIDVARSLVTVKDKFVSLGKKELEILILLTRKAGRIVTRDKLLTEERILVLKKKISNVAGEALQIKSVSGVGYKLVLNNPCG